MLNKIILIGRLTKAPELRHTKSEKAVCTFTLAVDSGFGDNKRTDFIDIVVWGKQGENCSKFLDKGKLAAVEGRLQIRSYEAKDGGKRYTTEIVADSVTFLSPKSDAAPADDPTGEPPWPADDEPF